MATKKCVFAGTFDPPTRGHKATIEDCLRLFDEVTVAVMVNPGKTPMFSPEERTEMLRLMFPDEARVKILSFDGTAAEFLRREGTHIYVRGVRSAADYEYETADYFSSAKLDKEILTVYLPCRQELLHVSSTAARTCIRFSVPLGDYVTEEVEKYIADALKKRARRE